MALVPCKECKKEVSDGAYRCPHCGATQRMHRGWWVVITPVGLFALLLGYGLTIPDYQHRATQQREACEAMIGGRGSWRQYECDRLYDEAMAKGREAEKQR